MNTTAAGLIFAIPLLMAHNAFVSRIKRLAGALTDAAHDLLALHAQCHTAQPVPHEAPDDARLSARH
jgi:biopolymer transport protein ExbB/TolQ